MVDAIDPILSKISQMQMESENDRRLYDARWQRNIKLSKGLPVEDKKYTSDVRNRQKMYFRKIWATEWRLLASFHAAFMRDPQSFAITGRDTNLDASKAKLLEFMTQYRIDKMKSTSSLFIKHLWGLQNILRYGIGAGKLSWQYDPEQGKDGPVYTVYPNEQVYLDFTADTLEEMRYVIFESFMTKDQLEENNYDNIDEAQAEGAPNNQVRNARFFNNRDPLQNPGPNEYPKAGSYEETGKDNSHRAGIYRVWEVFWREKGKIKFCITNKNHCFLRKVQDNPYGKEYPIVLGQCLTESNKLVGEGFPEPMEGPQESFNYNLNMRKDNIALQLNPPTVVSRYGNVDLNALTNLSARKVVLADSPDAVNFTTIPDATRMAYQEAAADEGMMRDVSGVTLSVEGQTSSDTATGDQINLTQGNAKIELYLAIGGETYFKRFTYLLAYLIQRFETDENVFTVATKQMIQEGYQAGFHSRIDDFDADVTINVGMAYAGREQEIRQTLLVLDRGAVYNQTQLALLQTNAVPPEGIQMFNGSQLFRDLLPRMGKKELDKYFVTIPKPPMMGAGMPGMSVGGQALTGSTAPQIGNGGAPQNDFQTGSQGGF